MFKKRFSQTLIVEHREEIVVLRVIAVDSVMHKEFVQIKCSGRGLKILQGSDDLPLWKSEIQWASHYRVRGHSRLLERYRGTNSVRILLLLHKRRQDDRTLPS